MVMCLIGIIPVFKKGDYLDPKNYRPVAILPIFSKILERLVFNQIIEYMNENDLIPPSHHAYRKNHNTTSALVQMYDSWIDNFDRGVYSGVCFLDMSAAFDIVDHSLLLQKLELYGFDEGSISWLCSYLSDRSQCVSINSSCSSLLAFPTGVPQGSILGPLLYIQFSLMSCQKLYIIMIMVKSGLLTMTPVLIVELYVVLRIIPPFQVLKLISITYLLT